MDTNNPALFLFDENEKFKGVFISPELWAKIEKHVRPHLNLEEDEQLPPEPISKWNDLLDYWDFKYPVDYSVRCDLCGEETSQWLEDEPRKFHLINCNLGGKVIYHCHKCGAKVTKMLFKDKIKFTATAPVEKDPELNAIYGDKNRTGKA